MTRLYRVRHGPVLRMSRQAGKNMRGDLPLADLIVVEDDPLVRDLVCHVLAKAGHGVRAATDGAGLRHQLAARRADLVVLDLGLPDGDGLSLARELRADAAAQTGIIVLSALAEPMDRIAGLEVGADDYLAKPFEPKELLARIEAVLRRRRPEAPSAARLGPWRVEPAQGHAVHEDGRSLRLSPSEVALILAFVHNPGRVLSREELLDLAPGREDLPFDRSIDHRIARLRKKLEADPRHPALIRSVRGRGYAFLP